jgi:hypothetical protein
MEGTTFEPPVHGGTINVSKNGQDAGWSSAIPNVRIRLPPARQAAKLCYRFGPLTPSTRFANLITGDGAKNGLPAPNKELAKKPKQPLDTKSPRQVRIHSSPARSLV